MDVSHIFDPLNDAQREAVAAPLGPLLVLAGAGSGKTRVLTHRVAWLVQACQVSPLSILAVTFTNKASREMRGRIERMLGFPVGGMWMGTFHGLCHRMLRAHAADAGLPETFEILDSDDQYRLVRRLLKQLQLDEAYWPPKQVQWFINRHKEEGRRARDLPEGQDMQQQTLLRVYLAYEESCRHNGLVDFAELLLRSLELLQNNQSIREHYQQRFEHLLVDEFQDTNAIQYRWLKLLAAPRDNLFAVGDDDQSIYGWRGARVENILSFQHDYPQARIVRLEQNYRSTATILAAANAVIAHNEGRLGKKLWTEIESGEAIRLYAASNEIDEARFVVGQIGAWLEQGHPRDSVAVLYRSNALSRVFEEQLLANGIPYRVYGGLRFFERAEIKDALAYLRLLSNRHSDAAFERVVNLPARGIGDRTLDQIREHARAHGESLWAAANALIGKRALTSRAASAVQRFLDLIDGMAAATKEMELAEQTDTVLKSSGLLDHYRREKGEKAETRVENLKELVTAAGNFDPEREGELDPLSSFLAHAALEAGEGQAGEWEECVQLMSLHSAKGLEFPLVFLCGMEEGLFPHQRSLEEPGRLEEERRLCYVGMTRAMRQLYICYAEVRRLYGRENYSQPSRFLAEIPPEHVMELRSPRISRPLRRREGSAGGASSPSGLKLGSRVRHPKFGEGIVINLEGADDHARVQVNFEGAGSKWLVCAYARLERI